MNKYDEFGTWIKGVDAKKTLILTLRNGLNHALPLYIVNRGSGYSLQASIARVEELTYQLSHGDSVGRISSFRRIK